MTTLDDATFQARDGAHKSAPGILAQLEAAGDLAPLDQHVAHLPLLATWVAQMLSCATDTQTKGLDVVDSIVDAHEELTDEQAEAVRYLLWDRLGSQLDGLVTAAEQFIAHLMGDNVVTY